MFAVPHEDDTLLWRQPGHDDVVEHRGRRSMYTYNSRPSHPRSARAPPALTHVEFSVANMTIVDAAYELAGMEPRRPGA